MQIHKVPIEAAFEWGGKNYKELIPYFKEPTFFISPYYSIEVLFKLTALIMYTGYFFALFIFVFLLSQMKKYKTLIVEEL